MKGEDLAGCFTGTLQHFAGTLHAGGTAPRLHSERLLDPSSLRELIERFGAANPDGEPRAVVSMWTQWHFAAVIVPSVVATLLGRVHLPVALGRATLALHENGCTAGVVISPGQLLDPSPAEGRPLLGLAEAPLEQCGCEPRLDRPAMRCACGRRPSGSGGGAGNADLAPRQGRRAQFPA